MILLAQCNAPTRHLRRSSTWRAAAAQGLEQGPLGRGLGEGALHHACRVLQMARRRFVPTRTPFGRGEF